MNDIPKLPTKWRSTAYTVDPSSAPDDFAATFPELIQASEKGVPIAFRLVDGNFRTFGIEVFVGGHFHRTFGSFPLLKAIEWVEKFASYLPGSFVVGSEPVAGRKVALNPIRASDLASREVAPRNWLVQNLIPSGEVTSLYGDGGTGKSMIALQLAIAVATGARWMGRSLEKGRTLFITAEDDLDEVHRRVAMISEREGVQLSELHDLSVVSLAGEDALLAASDGDSGTIEATSLYEMIEAKVTEEQPTLIVLDTLADFYGGDFINRGQVKRFVNLLKRLTLPSGAAVFLLAHPSLAGINSGMGTSDSTTWNNSVRSRLYLERIYVWRGRGDDKKIVEPDPDQRVLSNKKLNYGRTGETFHLEWRDGLYMSKSTSEPAPLLTHSKAAEDVATVDKKFMELLAAYTLEGRNVTHVPTGSYAPTVFAKDPRSEGIGKVAFTASLTRLLASKTIIVEEHGPPSKRRSRIAGTVT